MLGTLSGVVAAVALPLAPIVIPLAAAYVVGQWTVLLLEQS